MKKFLAIAFPLLLLAVACSAQSYDSLLAKVKSGDMSIDYKGFRRAFVEQGGVSVTDPMVHAGMLKAMGAKNYKEAVKLAEAVQKTAYVDMNSHIVAAMAHGALGDTKKSKFHEGVYLGLINSVVKERDGNTLQTAYEVISLAEVPVILNALELRRTGTEFVEENGHRYGVLTATEQGTNAVVKVYFNIDLAPKPVDKPVKP